MLKINYMSTLFVGIDVSSKSNVVYAMDFDECELPAFLTLNQYFLPVFFKFQR